MRRWTIVALALLATAGLACGQDGSATGVAAAPSATFTARPQSPSARSHVVLIVMENKERGEALGSPAAPYLTSLARRGATATDSFGVTHPSLPNYLALVSGSTQGITDDCTACSANAPNIADQLERAHGSWRAYLRVRAPAPPPPAATPRSTTRSPMTTRLPPTQHALAGACR